jgi:hypothetical protein
MAVTGTGRNAQFNVTYFAGGVNVTRSVLDGTYRTDTLKSDESATLTVKVTKHRGARPGSTRTFRIHVVSAHADNKDDTVAAVVRAARG